MKEIIICVVLYLIWVALYLGWSYFKERRTIPTTIIGKPSKSENIMGQTRSTDRQIEPTNAKESHSEESDSKRITFAESNNNKHSRLVENDELDSVFENSKMELDLDSESIEDEIPKESLPCFDGYDTLPSETGVEYDEMENLAKVVANKEVRAEKIEEASATAYKTKDTELLDAVINGYENGLQKVSAMLAKHEAMQQAAIPKIERFEEFELTNYL